MLNNQLIGQDKFIKVLPNTRKYLVEDFIDFSNTFIFGAKTPEEVIIEEIKKDYYSFEEYEGVNYVRFAEGFPIEIYDRIKVLKAEDMVSVPVHFTTVSSITPDSLNRNFDTLGEITRVIQEIFNNRALRIDAPDGEVLLPKLESGYFWVKTDVGYKAESLETYASKIEDYTTSQLNAISSAIGVLQTGYIKLIEDGKKEGDRHLLSFLETFKMFVEEQKKSIASSATGIKNELDVHATEKKKEMSDLTLALNSSLIKEGEKQKDGITTHSVEVLKNFNKSADEKTAEEIGKIETALENEISENGLNARQENVEERQADVEWRMSRLEVFRLGDTPSPSKLKSVIGVKDGRFGYWDRDKQIPVNADHVPLNWQDNGVFSDLPKPVTLQEEHFPMLLPTMEDEVHENADCRITIKHEDRLLELTKYTHITHEEEDIITSETRYHDYKMIALLEEFEELWSESWLWEEVEQRGDYEVVINRKHNEIVLGKVKERITYEFEGELKEAVTWEHKYLPFYPYLSTQDLLDQFDQFWELEPYTISAFAVPTGDYEIAGQVLKNGLGLGERYENLANIVDKVGATDSLNYEKIDSTTYKITIATLGSWEQFSYRLFSNLFSDGELFKKNDKLTVGYEILEGDVSKFKAELKTYSSGIGENAKNVSNKKSDYMTVTAISDSLGNQHGSWMFGLRFINVEVGTVFIIRFSLTKTSEPKPYIKNSRPDSRLALPQLSSLGAITSTEMRGNNLVAQHANGTAIIKNAVVNPNAPHRTFWWGIQPYRNEEGNKRLFCSTADNTYPTGWENLKFDVEEGGNVVFYDVARNSSTNNIAGLITEENGVLKIYVGEGYQAGAVGKPFTTGIVPNGSLKIVCDWTNLTHSFVMKGVKKNSTTYYFSALKALFDIQSCEGYSREINSDYISMVFGNELVLLMDETTKVKSTNHHYSQNIKINTGGLSIYNMPFSDPARVQYFEKILIYNNPSLTQAQMEGELAKDIYLPTYHHQENSVINAYGIQGMGAMYLYSPPLTSAEIDAELEKDIYLPKTQYDIPDWQGNS